MDPFAGEIEPELSCNKESSAGRGGVVAVLRVVQMLGVRTRAIKAVFSQYKGPFSIDYREQYTSRMVKQEEESL